SAGAGVVHGEISAVSQLGGMYYGIALAFSLVARRARSTITRSCVPVPISSVSSRARTVNSMRRPSTRVTSASPATRCPIGVGATPQRLAFLRRHFGLECLNDAIAPEDARQGQRGAVLRLVGADRNDRALVAQNNFGDPRRDHADAVLAGADAFDDRDIGKTH